MDSSFRVIAIIAAFNEEDVISPVIGHLVENGVDVYLIDNRSTDDTVAEAKRWLGRGLIDIETFPPAEHGDAEPREVFDWTAILRRKEELAMELRADWFIHHDADEVRDGPWPGMSLGEAIRWVDRHGYNCIDFRTLTFPPVDDGFARGDDPRSYFTLFEEKVAEFDRKQVKCWNAHGVPVSLVPSGGHDVSFDGKRLFPVPFLLRHYPVRGQTHGLKKVFAERKRRLLEHERSQGWHVQYDHIQDEAYRFLRSPDELSPFDLDTARLELLLPGNLVRRFTERLLQSDNDLAELRARCEGLARGLEEYAKHARDLEVERDAGRQRVEEVERERWALKAQVDDVKRGLDEYTQHARNLELEREADLQRVDELDRERWALRAQVTDLTRGVEQYARHAEELEREREGLLRRVDELEQAHKQLEQTHEEIQQAHNELGQAHEAMQREISAMTSSRSWRWTAPLRRLVDALGRRIG